MKKGIAQYKDLTHQIIGSAMRIHRMLGHKLREVSYQRSFEIELQETNLPYIRERKVGVSYRGRGIGSRRADFIVDGKILVELKAIPDLKNIHMTQAINYLELYILDVGLLINFGAPSLQFRRLYNNKLSH